MVEIRINGKIETMDDTGPGIVHVWPRISPEVMAIIRKAVEELDERDADRDGESHDRK